MALPSNAQFGPYATQACASWVLKSITRWRTRSRRASSAAAVEVGLASIDLQMPNSPQVLRALALSLPAAHRRLRSGMLITSTFAAGRPLLSLPSAASIEPRKMDVAVIVASELVHASLAPISIITYWTP